MNQLQYQSILDAANIREIKLNNKIEELKQQILDAEKVIRNLTKGTLYRKSLAQEYWEKYENK